MGDNRETQIPGYATLQAMRGRKELVFVHSVPNAEWYVYWRDEPIGTQGGVLRINWPSASPATTREPLSPSVLLQYER